MIMLKCGQTGNKKYTFGLRKEQVERAEDTTEKVAETSCCSECGVCIPQKSSYCPNCGAKI